MKRKIAMSASLSTDEKYYNVTYFDGSTEKITVEEAEKNPITVGAYNRVTAFLEELSMLTDRYGIKITPSSMEWIETGKYIGGLTFDDYTGDYLKNDKTVPY